MTYVRGVSRLAATIKNMRFQSIPHAGNHFAVTLKKQGFRYETCFSQCSNSIEHHTYIFHIPSLFVTNILRLRFQLLINEST